MIQNQNPFQIFNLPITFNISITNLEQIYTSLQLRYHPDNSTNKPLAQLQSSLVNQAYDILKNPLHRAELILKLQYNTTLEDADLSSLEHLMEEIFTLTQDIEEGLNRTKEINSAYQDCITHLSNDDLTLEKRIFYTAKLKYYSRLFEKL